ncbi:hypothetical protein ACTFIW_011126 [Dictyostelium discoideum]
MKNNNKNKNNKNNNNNNLENENDIDDNELEKKSLKSIKEIAQSYSISTTKLKKAEIIEKIKSIVKRKREYEEEEEQKENVNSFNKIIKLTITDNIEPTEILFWKLFRNKAIYKKIFSFMDNQFSIGYDSIDDICKLVNSNQVNLIREKVYRNCRYLHFHPNRCHNHIEDIDFLVKLFSTIKEDDYRFYRNFLNIENDYFTSPNHIIQALIISKRLQVFKLFVNEFNYKPTKKDLLHSIISGSNKFIKYILELNSLDAVLFDRKIVDTDFRDFYTKGYGSNYPTKEDSFFKGFLCYLNNINLDDNDRDQYYKLLSTHNPYSDYGRFQINEKSTLKSLISTARLILKLKTPSASYKVQFKEECFPKILKKIEAVSTIEEIDNFIKKIDKVNLKSFLDDPINFNNSDNNEIKNFIKKLLKLYYLNFSIEQSNTLYFCYYHEDSNQDYKVFHFHHLIETAFRFGNFEILESYETINCLHFLPGIRQNLSDKNYDSYHCYKVLFSHCFNKGKKIRFIDHIIQRTIERPEPGLQIYFLYMLVIHNNIELVKYYSNKVGNNIQVDSIGGITPPTYYIESVEMLEYLFCNQCNFFKDVFFNGNKSTFYKNLELLKHFESLLYNSKLGSGSGSGNGSGIHSYNGLVSFIKGTGFGSGVYGFFEYKENNNYADFAKHFASNPQIYKGYKFDYEHLFLLLTTPVSSSSSFSSKISINFETLRNLLTKAYSFGRNPIFERSTPKPTQHHYSREYLKFFDWMYLNYNNELKGCKSWTMNQQRSKYHLLIAIDRIDLDKDNYYDGSNGSKEEGNISIYIERLNSLTNDVIYFTPYLYEINNFKFLNWFLTIIEKYHNSTSISSQDKCIVQSMIYSFMEYITLYSKLQILEYIHHNFHFILKKQSDGGILNIGELKSFLFSSLKRDSIKISKFLFQFITITKNEFGKYSNEKTKSYFKNMFK